MTPLARHLALAIRQRMETSSRFVYVEVFPVRIRLWTPPAVMAAIAAPPLKILPRLNQPIGAPLFRWHFLGRVFIEVHTAVRCAGRPTGIRNGGSTGHTRLPLFEQEQRDNKPTNAKEQHFADIHASPLPLSYDDVPHGTAHAPLEHLALACLRFPLRFFFIGVGSVEARASAAGSHYAPTSSTSSIRSTSRTSNGKEVPSTAPSYSPECPFLK